MSSVNLLAYWTKWFGFCMIFLGIAIDALFVLSDIAKWYLLVGFPEEEMEIVGIVIWILGLVFFLIGNDNLD
jgi:hypothetical protein